MQHPWLLGIALSSYVTVTWLLTIRPQPRYYLFAVYAATLAVALLAGQGRTAIARRIAHLLLGAAFFTGTMMIILSPYRPRDAELILPWLARHPGTAVYLTTENARRMAFPAILVGRQRQIRMGTAPVGALRAHIPSEPAMPGEWRQIELLRGPRLFPYINAGREIPIEQRVR